MKREEISVRFKATSPNEADTATEEMTDAIAQMIDSNVKITGKRLACDRCDATTSEHPHFAEAMADAYLHGWTRDGDDDICPAHKETR